MEEKLDLILLRIKMLEGQLVELKQSLDAHRHEHTAMQHPGIAGQMRGGDAGMGGMGMSPGGFPPGAGGYQDQQSPGGSSYGPPGM